MARFNAAFMSGSVDEKFQNRYNYLLDLLDQGYIVEKMIGNKMSRVEISPSVGIKISYGTTDMLSIDPTTGDLRVSGLDADLLDGREGAGYSKRYSSSSGAGIINNACHSFYGVYNGIVLLTISQDDDKSKFLFSIHRFSNSNYHTYTVLANSGITISAVNNVGTVAIAGNTSAVTFSATQLI